MPFNRHSPHDARSDAHSDARSHESSAWRIQATGAVGLYEQAVVERTIHPGKTGRVKFRASWWSARCLENTTIAVGELVDIVDIEGITLIVEPTVLLKADAAGLAKIQQAWQQKGWTLQQPEPQGRAAIIVFTHGQETDPGDIAAETWQRFLQRKPIHIKTFQACCELLGLNWQEIVGSEVAPLMQPVLAELDAGELLAPAQAEDQSLPTQLSRPEFAFNFVGRDQSIKDLNQLVQAGARLITILGTGGMGKTTLARQYLSHHFDLVLECWIAKETANLTSAETLVQEWLQRYFGEQPGRDFTVSLERLRQQLCQVSNKRIGVLIDNLETALDRHGRLIESQRQYAALLEVLADPRVQSVTLVTSREMLHEVNITVQPYVLPSLDVAAWRAFFQHCQIITTSPEIEQMHQAYNGNAKAMTILSSVIKVDCEGCLAIYWQEHQADLLGESSLEGLVASHFTRLRQLYPEAYRLLCRLGCYRYQDIAAIPLEGCIALLWDVPETEHRRVVRFLRDLFLIEISETGYRLHPTIQAKAIELLHQQQEWEIANRQAAKFWSAVSEIETIEQALVALEAYHHYVQIQDWSAAAAVILQQRSSESVEAEPLGVSFYRLGLLRPMITAITRIIQQIQPDDSSGRCPGHLHRILGDLYWLTGSILPAIDCHTRAHQIAVTYNIPDLELVSLFNIGLCYIDLWELEQAFRFFSTVSERANQTEHHVYAVGSWFCLALLHAYRGDRDRAMQLMQQVSQEFEVISSSSWSRCYSLLFLGLTATQIGDMESAFRLYELAKFFAERSHYPQVKARALSGLAELCRQQLDFQGAVTNLLDAKRLLDRLEARADLAEVHYQLGLTYYRLNDIAASQANFAVAVQLFEQMQAPKQVERVRQTMQTITTQ